LICYILPKNEVAGGWDVEGYLKILASQKLSRDFAKTSFSGSLKLVSMAAKKAT